MSDLAKHPPWRVGCASWTLSRAEQQEFPPTGTHLERYALRLPAVEVNSSFNRSHRASTYARWAESVPDEFRFSVKLPRMVTHRKRLVSCETELDAFLGEIAGLGDKLGCLLVQLPPSLDFDESVASVFLNALRRRYSGGVVLEPRHPAWFTRGASKLLSEQHVGRVAADPAMIPLAAEPGGWLGLVYFRLHGSPRMYYSSYTTTFLNALVSRIQAYERTQTDVWCIFDNTASGAATANALHVHRRLSLLEPGTRPKIRHYVTA